MLFIVVVAAGDNTVTVVWSQLRSYLGEGVRDGLSVNLNFNLRQAGLISDRVTGLHPNSHIEQSWHLQRLESFLRGHTNLSTVTYFLF